MWLSATQSYLHYSYFSSLYALEPHPRAELFQSVNNGKALLETAIIDRGGHVSKKGEVATFEELAQTLPYQLKQNEEILD